MLSFRAFINERLAAAAEEIFGAVEKTIIEYKEEICRSKDLEISRLRIQLKLLKSDSPLDKSFAAQLEARSHHHLHQPPPQQEQQHHHQSFPADDAPESQQCDDDDDEGGVEEEEEGSSVHPEHPQPSLVKKEQQKSHDDFWMDHSDEHEQLELESDIKDFMQSPSSLRSGLHDPTLSFHASYSNNSSNGEESREKPYCCSVCEKRFNNSCHLAAHIRTHTGERPYRCEICRKTFITTSALNRHQTIHTEGKHFICNYCGKTFKWMESLSRHVRSVHKRQSLSSQ